MVTFVNKLTVNGDIDAFLAVKKRLTAYMSSRPGYVSDQTLRSIGDENVFLEVAVWQDPAQHRQAASSPEFQELIKELRPLIASAEPALYETVGATEAAVRVC